MGPMSPAPESAATSAGKPGGGGDGGTQSARLARVSSLSLFPAYGIGVIGYAVDGPLAAVLGPALVFGVGAVYGLLSSAVMLAVPSVRAVRWLDEPEPEPEP